MQGEPDARLVPQDRVRPLRRRCVAKPRHAVEVRAQEEHLARWLTRRIDLPVKLFDLREQGFELIGGRLLPDGDG